MVWLLCGFWFCFIFVGCGVFVCFGLFFFFCIKPMLSCFPTSLGWLSPYWGEEHL